MTRTVQKLAIVTGALGGIGRATVWCLVRDGWNIAASYAEGVESQELAMALLQEHPGQISIHPLDLGRRESIEIFVAAVVDRWSRVDALVNNAGVGSATVKAYASDTLSQDEAMLRINAGGTLVLTQLFIDRLQGQWGDTPLTELPAAKLVNISSVGGGIASFPSFRLSDGMSKAALAFMSRQLAAEHVHTPLDVFAICPGATNTGMFQASTLINMNNAEKDIFLSTLPKQRLIQPEEIAEIIAFLLTPHSRVLHGTVLDASMGLGCRPGILTEVNH